MIKVFWQTRGLKSNTPISTEIFMLSTVIRTIYGDKKSNQVNPLKERMKLLYLHFKMLNVFSSVCLLQK